MTIYRYIYTYTYIHIRDLPHEQMAGWGFEPRNPGYDPGTLSTRLSLPRMSAPSLDPAICPPTDPDRKVGGAN